MSAIMPPKKKKISMENNFASKIFGVKPIYQIPRCENDSARKLPGTYFKIHKLTMNFKYVDAP